MSWKVQGWRGRDEWYNSQWGDGKWKPQSGDCTWKSKDWCSGWRDTPYRLHANDQDTNDSKGWRDDIKKSCKDDKGNASIWQQHKWFDDRDGTQGQYSETETSKPSDADWGWVFSMLKRRILEEPESSAKTLHYILSRLASMTSRELRDCMDHLNAGCTGSCVLSDLKDANWNEIAMSLQVEDAVALTKCCSQLLQTMAAASVQRTLWKNEGVLWAADLQVPLLMSSRLHCIPRWRRALFLPGCYPRALHENLDQSAGPFGASGGLQFNCVEEWDLTNLALKKLSTYPGVGISELTFPGLAFHHLAVAARRHDWKTAKSVNSDLYHAMKCSGRLALRIKINYDSGDDDDDNGLSFYAIPFRLDGKSTITGLPNYRNLHDQRVYLVDVCHHDLAECRADKYDLDDFYFPDIDDVSCAHESQSAWEAEWLSHVADTADSAYVHVKLVSGWEGSVPFWESESESESDE